jgi:ubiquinone/menaquinone biosynthesis C-methylase UbiE
MNPYRLARRGAGRILRAIPWTRRWLMLSADYSVVTMEEARRRQRNGWHSWRVAAQQDAAYRALLDAMHAGNPRIDLTVAAQAVDAVGLSRPSLLEVGCGTGYYSEILATLGKSRLDYTGLDYSPAMVARARIRYPHGRFEVGDATALAHPDGAFDLVFNGVSLMHILDYQKAIAEHARVARQAVIFHSVPVFPDYPTTQFHKYAYGGPMVESVFNRGELLALFAASGLEVMQNWRSIDYDVSHVVGAASHAETFLCRKKP